MSIYKDKTILITGASSGIGEAFALQLDQLGAKLILTARSRDKLEELASKMNNAIVIDGDLSDKDFPDHLYNEIISRKIEVDILINNAGFGFSGLFLESDKKNYEEMLNLNIYSLTALTHLFLKDMVARKSGGIINISSLASFQPMPFFAVYAATKSYVTSFTTAIYEEYGSSGINILGVCPGYTKTNFNKRAQISSQSMPGYTMSSDTVVKQSLRAFEKKKYIIINGKINSFAKFITSILPQKWSLKMTKTIIKKGIGENKW